MTTNYFISDQQGISKGPICKVLNCGPLLQCIRLAFHKCTKCFFFLNKMMQPDAFNLITKEPEAGGSLSRRTSWSTE